MLAVVWHAVGRPIDGAYLSPVRNVAPTPVRTYRGSLEELRDLRDARVARLAGSGRQPLVEEWTLAGVPMWTLTWYYSAEDAIGDDDRERADLVEVWQILKE